MTEKKGGAKKKIKKITANPPSAGYKAEKIPTFISNFDSICNGGLNKESVNLLVGGAGSGKTIFSIQFLIGGLKNGETCMYITFEEKREELFRNMLEFGFNLEEYEKKGKFIFIEYSPEKVKSMLEEGGGTLESLVYKSKINRLVIDSITSFTLLFESELAKREAALSLFEIIKRWKCSILMTMEKELSKEELISGSESAIEFEVDSVILMFFLRMKEGKRQRMIEVLKMRGTKHSEFVYPFSINDKGIEVSKNALKNIHIQ